MVRRAQAGEGVAFELLVDTHRGAVRSHALRMLRVPEDADDAVQDTFLKAYRALYSFDPGRPVLPWLIRICTNCCIDLIRNRRPEVECIESHEHALFDARSAVDENFESSYHGEKVRDAVGRLPERYRQIILMRHFRHMDVCEIAHELNKPEGTIKSWLFRARALLRKDLKMALGPG